MKIPFRLVDVFTDRPLAGNQLCVVPDHVEGLNTRLMQAIAQEIGFSETTFVQEVGGDRYAMRIFTPVSEMPFAGHPTLGTAFVLASEGRITSPATQVVAAGEFVVEADLEHGLARMRQLPPEFGPKVDAIGPLAAALDLPERDLRTDLWPQMVTTGLPHLIVAAQDSEAVSRASPDVDALGRVLDATSATGLYLFATLGEGEAKARMFAPEVGVTEDPATGSAAGPLGAYLAEHGVGGFPGKLLIHQGKEIGRPSELRVEVRPNGDTWEVWVEGSIVIVGRGAFEL